jgi:hypothetical protein
MAARDPSPANNAGVKGVPTELAPMHSRMDWDVFTMNS